MDVRTALIAGTAFAGVLIAGAVAAPRGGGDSSGAPATSQTVSTNAVQQQPGDTLVDLPASSSRSVRESRDGDHHDGDDHDDGHEEDDD